MNVENNHRGEQSEFDADRAAFDELIQQAGLQDEQLDGFSAEVDADLDAWERMQTLQANAGEVALVLTNLLEALPLAALLSSQGIDAQIVETESGCVVYKQLPPGASDGVESLLGEERPLPKEAEELAQRVSQITPYGAVLFVSTIKDKSETDPGVHGQIVGRVYYDGVFDRIVAAGPLVACLDEKIEDMLLGRTTPEHYPKVKKPRMRDIASWMWRQTQQRGDQ